VFGKSKYSNGSPTPAPQPVQRPVTSDLAKIQGGGLVQLIVNETYPVDFFLFLNHTPIAAIDIDSVSIDVVAPDNPSEGIIVRATLSQYVTNVAGERVLQNKELFPCTIEVIALDRRLAVTCTRHDSTDGLWVSVGLRANGESSELTGLREFRFLLNHDMLDARVTWVDGESENLLPQP
jgi:hypothetical protein